MQSCDLSEECLPGNMALPTAKESNRIWVWICRDLQVINEDLEIVSTRPFGLGVLLDVLEPVIMGNRWMGSRQHGNHVLGTCSNFNDCIAFSNWPSLEVFNLPSNLLHLWCLYYSQCLSSTGSVQQQLSLYEWGSSITVLKQGNSTITPFVLPDLEHPNT